MVGPLMVAEAAVAGAVRHRDAGEHARPRRVRAQRERGHVAIERETVRLAVEARLRRPAPRRPARVAGACPIAVPAERQHERAPEQELALRHGAGLRGRLVPLPAGPRLPLAGARHPLGERAQTLGRLALGFLRVLAARAAEGERLAAQRHLRAAARGARGIREPRAYRTLALTSGAAAETWRGLELEPEHQHRCSPYDKKRHYPYPQSVERDIVRGLGAVYGPYTGTCFGSTRDTDIEHIVAACEAHHSGLCGRDRCESRAAWLSCGPNVRRGAWVSCWFIGTSPVVLVAPPSWGACSAVRGASPPDPGRGCRRRGAAPVRRGSTIPCARARSLPGHGGLPAEGGCGASR